jgi:Ser/Thr protein kinase RdoA (MazF antagonist)
MANLESVLETYGIDPTSASIEVISSGLINPTWKISTSENDFILQRINTTVFREPYKLAENIRLLADYASINHPDYLFVAPTKAKDGNELVVFNGNHFRVFPFVKGSHTIQSVETPEQAYEAALQFGKFTKIFSGFAAAQLHSTIPDFHNLSFRYQQFKTSIRAGDQSRIQSCTKEINQVESYTHLVQRCEAIRKDDSFKLRVTHHDTKISNVLFDQNDKGICVIDLDTVMPGYFISDVGDMMRTYLSPTNEEDADFSKIQIRKEFFQATAQGYLESMREELSVVEMQAFYYAGLFIVYMQAIRFLADHFNNDQYYGARYENHNLVRAQNQLVLLAELTAQQKSLQSSLPHFAR